MPGADLAARRLPPAPHRARQRTAAHLRAPAGHRGRRARAVRRRRTARARRSRASRASDRPVARGGDIDPDRPRAGRGRSKTSAARSKSASTGGSLRVCCEDLPLALELLADVTFRPVFPAEALRWVSRRIAAELRGDLEDPAFRAELCFRALVYGAHPLARSARRGPRASTRLTRRDAAGPSPPPLRPREHAFSSRSAISIRARLMSLVKKPLRRLAAKRPVPAALRSPIRRTAGRPASAASAPRRAGPHRAGPPGHRAEPSRFRRAGRARPHLRQRAGLLRPPGPDRSRRAGARLTRSAAA